MLTREIHLRSRPSGLPSTDNFELKEVVTPSPVDGEILVRNEWMSVDPYMRGRMRKGKSYVEPFELDKPLEGGCIGRVVESRHSRFQVGDYVLGNKGWRDCWVSDGEGIVPINDDTAPVSAYLSVLGLTGMTAYVGLLKIGELKQGDNVFVSAASGAVGSIVCQIAKLNKCRVVGSAGSAEKIEWLKEKAGVDAAYNYHDVDDVAAKLSELFPNGIDVYFDNVGGDHLEGAIENMNDFGRIAACGMISLYNDETPRPGPTNLFKMIGKRLRMQGFIVRDHMDQRDEFVRDMTAWIDAKQIHWEETITEGLEHAPQAFIDLFHGSKMGKSLVKLSS